MQKVQAVISRAQDAPVEVTTINVPDTGPGEAVVKILTCGVCQTDLHYKRGGVGDNFPYLLGHEASGIVESVGDDVTSVAPGDHVILNWRAVCGQCRACRKGQPQYCFDTHNAQQKMTLEDGTELEPALGIGAFAEKTLVAAGQCTKIEGELTTDQYAAVGLLGCGITAGIGAAINTGQVSRGESVAVIGCGGVGTAAIAGAALAGATTIIAVDIDDDKLDTARSLGATHTINSKNTDPVEGIRELTDGNGADLVIDLHCDDESLQYAYIDEAFWPEASDLAAALDMDAVLLSDGESSAFEEAVSFAWKYEVPGEKKARLPGNRPHPLSSQSQNFWMSRPLVHQIEDFLG